MRCMAVSGGVRRCCRACGTSTLSSARGSATLSLRAARAAASAAALVRSASRRASARRRTAGLATLRTATSSTHPCESAGHWRRSAASG